MVILLTFSKREQDVKNLDSNTLRKNMVNVERITFLQQKQRDIFRTNNSILPTRSHQQF